MDGVFWQVFAGLCAAALLCAVLRRDQPVYAALCGAAAGVWAVLRMTPQAWQLILRVQQLGGQTAVQATALLLRCAAIAWCAELAAGLCADIGSQGLADKVLWAGRIGILVAMWPVVEGLVEVVAQLVPG